MLLCTGAQESKLSPINSLVFSLTAGFAQWVASPGWGVTQGWGQTHSAPRMWARAWAWAQHPSAAPDLHGKKPATIVTSILVRKMRVKLGGARVHLGSQHLIQFLPWLSCGASDSPVCPVNQEKPWRFSPGGCRESEQCLWAEPHFQREAQGSSGGAHRGWDQPRFLPRKFLTTS